MIYLLNSGEPNNVREKCAEFRKSLNFLWNDSLCDSKKPFICETNHEVRRKDNAVNRFNISLKSMTNFFNRLHTSSTQIKKSLNLKKKDKFII